MLLFANHYYNLGLNVTHISNSRKEFHLNEENILKAPSHFWAKYLTGRQSLEELHSFNWHDACGLGTVLQFNNLRALDIDGCNNIGLIRSFLAQLELPIDYEWVVKSGSKNGFHIVFYAPEHTLRKDPTRTTAILPNSEYINEFKHIKLRWSGHLVLPPSIHTSYFNYQFINCEIPYAKPMEINILRLNKMLEDYGGVIPIYPYTSIEHIFIDSFENIKNQ